MRTWQVTRLLAAREITAKVRSKAFLVSSGVTVLMIVGLAFLPGLVGGDDSFDVGVGGAPADAAALTTQLGAVAGALDVDVTVRDVAAADADRLVEAGDLDAFVTGDEVVVDEELDGDLEAVVQTALADVRARATLAELGVTAAEADDVLSPQPLRVRALDPPDPEEGDRDALVFFGTVILYAQLFGFGFWVATGLVEEKSSRVAELLLTKARPAQVLTGKVVGLGIVGFVQLVGIVGVGLVAASVSGAVDLPPGIAGVVAMVLGWFVLGYAFYACLFAIGGALASRAEDLQTTTTPVSMVVILAFFAALAAGGDQSGTIAAVTTFIPATAPLVLPIRHAAGELAWWELVGSVAVVLASIVGAVWLAGKAYAGAALHLRGTMRLREALRRAD